MSTVPRGPQPDQVQVLIPGGVDQGVPRSADLRHESSLSSSSSLSSFTATSSTDQPTSLASMVRVLQKLPLFVLYSLDTHLMSSDQYRRTPGDLILQSWLAVMNMLSPGPQYLPQNTLWLCWATMLGTRGRKELRIRLLVSWPAPPWRLAWPTRSITCLQRRGHT